MAVVGKHIPNGREGRREGGRDRGGEGEREGGRERVSDRGFLA